MSAFRELVQELLDEPAFWRILQDPEQSRLLCNEAVPEQLHAKFFELRRIVLAASRTGGRAGGRPHFVHSMVAVTPEKTLLAEYKEADPETRNALVAKYGAANIWRNERKAGDDEILGSGIL